MRINAARSQTAARRAGKNGKRLALPRLWQSVGWLMVVTVIVLTLMPKPPQPPLFFLNWDKVQHLLAYGGLMWWFRQAFIARLRWIVFLIGLGVILEFMQGWSGIRQFEYQDMLANGLGVMTGLLLAVTPLGSLVGWLDYRLAALLSTGHSSVETAGGEERRRRERS